MNVQTVQEKWTKKIDKNLSFSQNHLDISLSNLHRETQYQSCLVSFSELGILSLFHLGYNRNKLSVKLLKFNI